MATKRINPDAFGIVLKTYRLQKELTQEQLSEQVDVVRSFICRLESGKKQPSFDMVVRLAEALGVPPGEFVDAVIKLSDQ